MSDTAGVILAVLVMLHRALIALLDIRSMHRVHVAFIAMAFRIKIIRHRQLQRADDQHQRHNPVQHGLT